MMKVEFFATERFYILAVCLSVLPAVGARGQSEVSKGEPVNTAQAFARHLAAGKFEEAVKLCDEAVAAALPVDKLKSTWASIESSAGAFQSFGKSSVKREGGFHAVTIPAAFEAVKLTLKIVVNAKGEVGGFWILPGEPAQPYQLPPYDNAERYRETDVAFGKPPWTVKGKLTRPNSDALVPAVVLVHGSGPQDEDETIGPNKPFRDLAAGLSSNGVAVLRYQKRTHAYKFRLVLRKTITVREEVIDDALEALKFVRRQPGIDPSKVFVLGHSLGATMAPHIAWEDKKIAGAILLAGTARDFYDVLEDQLAYIASLAGPGQEANRKLHEETREAIAQVRAGKDVNEIKILNVPASYWNELSDYGNRSLARAKELKCRLFIAGGGRDYQVTEKDFELYRNALGKRENVTFRWYKTSNHLFMPGKKKATPNEYAKSNHIDEKVIRDLATWIGGR